LEPNATSEGIVAAHPSSPLESRLYIVSNCSSKPTCPTLVSAKSTASSARSSLRSHSSDRIASQIARHSLVLMTCLLETSVGQVVWKNSCSRCRDATSKVVSLGERPRSLALSRWRSSHLSLRFELTTAGTVRRLLRRKRSYGVNPKWSQADAQTAAAGECRSSQQKGVSNEELGAVEERLRAGVRLVVLTAAVLGVVGCSTKL